MIRLCLCLLLLFTASTAPAQITLTEGTNFSVHAGRDGRVVTDLLDRIWIVPASGGAAKAVVSGPLPARRPRWSPGADTILYQARTMSQDQLWLYDLDTDSARSLSDGRFFDQYPNWHPGGERIIYSSDRRDSGFDLWELDLVTGLTWRVTHSDGDETEPAWSADGRDLVYIHHGDDRWSLVLRRHGQPDRVLESAATRLSSPAWRPDGSLITFLRHSDAGLSIDMVILSDPPLIREILAGEDLFIAPVTWRGRQQMLYAANGLIRKRDFNAWTSTTMPFRATLPRQRPPRSVAERRRKLPATDMPGGQLVIRAERLFDGSGGYRHNLDIVIHGGRIAAVEERRDRPGAIVIDMGNVTAVPGFIDGAAALPEVTDASLGPLLLSFGVTTVVAEHPNGALLDRTWSGENLPGPRVLGKGWQLDLDWAATMVSGMYSLPTSPLGIRYQDLQLGGGGGPTTMLSGIADARTGGLRPLLASRQAAQLERYAPAAARRFTEKPELKAAAAAVVLGSRANGLQPGIALHAELLALAEAGLTGEQALRASGVNAATALGLDRQLGRIAAGYAADIVLVDGDPLAGIEDAQNVVAVVRNGRFFSAIGLIERAEGANSVE